MSLPLVVTVTARPISCFKCGITWWVDVVWENNRREDKANFWCPNGHSQAFVKSTVEQLKEQLAAKEVLLAAARTERDRVIRSRDAIKGQLTKVRKRVGNGVCPCCNRSFTNLQRHMHTQHPGFVDQEVGS